MPPAAHQFQTGARFGLGFGLGEDAAADRDHGVACQHEAGGLYCQRLLAPHAQGIGTGEFELAGGLVDIGGCHSIGRKAQPREQFAPPGRSRGKCQVKRRAHAAGPWPYCGPGPPRPGMKR